MAETQTEKKEIEGLAFRGRKLANNEFENPAAFPPPAKVATPSRYQDYRPSADIDYSDIAAVNREIVGIIQRLSDVRIELRQARRDVTKAKFAYDHEKRNLLIGITGGTEKLREAWAELRVEPLYTAYLVASAVEQDINQASRDMRTHLDALKEISNNLRRLIDLR